LNFCIEFYNFKRKSKKETKFETVRQTEAKKIML